MMTFSTLMLAALTSASLQRSPTQALVQEEHLRSQLMRSELTSLSESEKSKVLLEHARIGRELKEVFGFAWGQAFTNYQFRATVTNANAAQQSIFILPKPALGFSEFRPLVTEETLCGICLRRTLDGEFSEEALRATQDETRTNLSSQLGLQPEDVLLSTNGIRHAWRFSFEHWNKALVLRISDEEMVASLLRAAEERRRAEREVKKESETAK